MLGGHLYELIIVLVIALVVFGPKRLPELGSSLGKGIREFRRATNDLQDNLRTDTAPLASETHTTYATPSTTATQAEYTAAPRPEAETVIK